MTLRTTLTILLACPAIGLPQPSPPGAQPIAALRTVFLALDADSNQQLSYDEIARAAGRLMSLDADGDGRLSEREMGGGGSLAIRGQAVVRVMDTAGDSTLSPNEIDGASAALKRLDRDGDWMLSASELATRVRNPDDPNARARTALADRLETRLAASGRLPGRRHRHRATGRLGRQSRLGIRSRRARQKRFFIMKSTTYRTATSWPLPITPSRARK